METTIFIILISIFIGIYFIPWTKIYKNYQTSREIYSILSNKYNDTNKQLYIKIDESGTFASIKYLVLNTEYTIYVPYRRDYVAAMIPLKVEAVKGDKIINITQQPGLPYLVNAKEINADFIIATNTDTGEIKRFQHEYPMFLECLFE